MSFLGQLRVRPTKAFGLLMTLSLGAAIAWTYDLHSVANTAAEVPIVALLGATACLAAGLMLSTVRFALVMRALDLSLPFGLAFRANTLGILGGLMFFQVLGQLLARTAVLSKRGFGAPAILLANAYERIGALLSLGIMAACAALHLHGQITFSVLGGGAYLLKVVLVLAGCVALILYAMPELRIGGVRQKARKLLLGFGGLAVCSVLMHLTTLLAFTLLGAVVMPHAPLDKLIAASTIIMFAASIPISFAGWGLRELSAVYTFGMIGISAEKALATSILIGLASLLVVLIMGVVAHATKEPPAAQMANATHAASVSAKSRNIARWLAWFLPPMTALLIYFQIHVPLQSGTSINVNLADPVALAGGLVFLALYGSRSVSTRLWRPGAMGAMLLAVTAVLALAFVIGWFRFGMTDWALYNRLCGWFILLGYFATGALAFSVDGENGRRCVLRVMAIVGVTIATSELALLGAARLGLPVTHLLYGSGIMGLAKNPNAFALQLIAVLAIVCGGHPEARRQSGQWATSVFGLAIIIAALYATHSRAGYGTGAAVLAVAVSLGWLPWRTALAALFAAALLLVAIAFLPSMIEPILVWLGYGSGAHLVDAMNLAPKLSHASSDSQRWISMTRGFEMWLANPLFGAGLGAFMAEFQSKTGAPLVIHNATVWILAELGIVGLVTIGGMFASIAWVLWRDGKGGETVARSLFLLLLGCAMFQMVHEIFYQRIIWFLAGVALFAGPSLFSHPSPALKTQRSL